MLKLVMLILTVQLQPQRVQGDLELAAILSSQSRFGKLEAIAQFYMEFMAMVVMELARMTVCFFFRLLYSQRAVSQGGRYTTNHTPRPSFSAS